MALNFTGTALAPKRGGNPLGRKLEGVRVARLKKGQSQITFGEDVMAELGIDGDAVDAKLKASVTLGTEKFAGKLLVKFGEGEFSVRWTSPKRKTSTNIMSSALDIQTNGRARYKVFAADNAIVIELPAAEAATGAAPDLEA